MMTQKDFNDFLLQTIEEKNKRRTARTCFMRKDSLVSSRVGMTDNVSGDMDCSGIAEVDLNAGMSLSDFRACSMVMTVCQNMIQKTISNAALANGVEAAVALKNMNAWVQAFVDFPLPFFNFVDTQNDVYKKTDFKLSADPDIVDKVLNIKNVPDLKDAVSAALHKTGGDIVSYQGTSRNFNYFGIIKAYFDTRIEFRVVKYSLNLKETDVKVLCASTGVTKLDSSYDTYLFEADKEFLVRMQSKMGDQMADFFAEKLFDFIKMFYQGQLDDFKEKLATLFKKG